MKIIVEDEKEKQELLRTCQYIHDFSVFWRRMGKKSEIEIIRSFDESIEGEKFKRSDFKEVGGISLDLEMFPLLNLLAGLYDAEDEYREDLIRETVIVDKEKGKNKFQMKGR